MMSRAEREQVNRVTRRFAKEYRDVSRAIAIFSTWVFAQHMNGLEEDPDEQQIIQSYRDVITNEINELCEYFDNEYKPAWEKALGKPYTHVLTASSFDGRIQRACDRAIEKAKIRRAEMEQEAL